MHKHARVKIWPANRPRFHIHYTPTYAFWLNEVERWFGLITLRAIRRGSFSSVRELVARTDSFVHYYDQSSRSFLWPGPILSCKRLLDFIHECAEH